MSKFNYFVSYLFKNGQGNVSVSLDFPISNFDIIRELEKEIATKVSEENILILNWKRFEDEQV